MSEFSDSNESVDEGSSVEDIDDSVSEEEPTTFDKLGVSSWILAQLSGLGISKPSPVQRHCIPPVLAGRDCVGVAKTGQGKTFAFAIPILQTLSVDPSQLRDGWQIISAQTQHFHSAM